MDFIKKWYTYQKERFPVIAFGIYVFAIVFATYCVTSNLTSNYGFNWKKIILMFIVVFLQFLMVRIVDEFKDYDEDCKYRPYRPVPRGLITLKELKVLFVICLVIQVTITLCFCKYSFPFLILLWVMFALMTKGFFIKKILDEHLLLEVLFDEIMMPTMVLYDSNFVGHMTDFISNSVFIKFLILSYIVSWIIEIARKIRCKEDEENGVRTYTAVYGIPKATGILSILEIILFVLQVLILNDYMRGMMKLIIGASIAIVLIINSVFVVKKSKVNAKLAELAANIYIFAVYFSMVLLIV